MAFVSCPPCNQNCDQGRSCPAVIHGSAECRHNDTGMSLRDYFAAKAVQGMFAADTPESYISAERKASLDFKDEAMSKEDIIRMAREAGLIRTGDGWTEPHRWGMDEIERFAALVAAAEREACAQILDHNANACANNSVLRDVLQGNATAIRARNNT